MTEIREQILADFYGTCVVIPCQCLKTGWLGRACPNWVPVKANDYEELRKEMGGDDVQRPRGKPYSPFNETDSG